MSYMAFKIPRRLHIAQTENCIPAMLTSQNYLTKHTHLILIYRKSSFKTWLHWMHRSIRGRIFLIIYLQHDVFSVITNLSMSFIGILWKLSQLRYDAYMFSRSTVEYFYIVGLRNESALFKISNKFFLKTYIERNAKDCTYSYCQKMRETCGKNNLLYSNLIVQIYLKFV